MLFFADRGEGAATLRVLMGSVTTVVVSMLLLIGFLDSPFHGESAASVRSRWSERFESSTRRCRPSISAWGAPCDAHGNPAS